MKCKVKQKSIWLAAVAALAAFSGTANAAPARDARQDLDYLERQRQQSNIQKEIEREREISEQNKAIAPAPDTEDKAPKPEARFLVSEIRLLGDAHPAPEVEAILASYRGTIMGATEIMAIVRDLTNHYISKGFVTTVVTVHPGKLSGGELTLEVRWGTIKDLTLNGKAPQGVRDALRLFSAMPFAAGRRLNMADIDQAVDNLMKGGGNDKIQIVPGDDVGGSVLDVTTGDAKMLTFGAGVNNNGRQVEGWNQYSATIGVNNLLGLNDALSPYYAQQDFKDPANLQQIGSVSYNLPIGYWNFDASWYGSRYEKAIVGAFGRYASDGTSERYSLRATRLLRRDASGKTSAYVKVGTRKNANGIEGRPIDVSSKTYSELTLGLTHVGAMFGGWTYGDISLTAGVPWMGAAWRGDADLAGFDTDYTKINGMLTWSRPFKLGGIDLQYELGAGFQYSQDTMVTDARLAIGDEFTVRGFKDTSFYGDSGAYLSNTLRLPIRADVLGGIELAPFVGYDVGFVKGNQPGAAPEYLIGAAVGLRFSGKFFTSSLTYGWPLAAPAQPQPLARAINYRLDLRY